MMPHQVLLWTLFIILVIALLALDLGVFHRHAHEIKVREAIYLSLFWIALALLFNLGIYFYQGKKAAIQFLTGYLIEKSLSVDNLFVFLLIFSYFKVPSKYQHKVLFFGILGALIMRAVFILLGVSLIRQFHWIMYVFGAFLVFTGIKLAFQKDQEIHPEKNPLLRLIYRYFPISAEYDGDKFITLRNGRKLLTPMLVVLIFVETTDVVFAVDSIPAIFAITLDPFIIYSSNVFAILGLRALYFALAGIMRLFHHLHYGLSIILVFVGVKMLIADFYRFHESVALGFIGLVLALSIVASILFPKKETLENMPNPKD